MAARSAWFAAKLEPSPGRREIMVSDVDTMEGTAGSAPAALWQPDDEMADRDLLVILVAFGNTESLEEALRVLGLGRCVVVVDNGAEEDVRRVAERHGAGYLTPGRNAGFAAAVNLGLSRREGQHVLLLNPDARVSRKTV